MSNVNTTADLFGNLVKICTVHELKKTNNEGRSLIKAMKENLQQSQGKETQ